MRIDSEYGPESSSSSSSSCNGGGSKAFRSFKSCDEYLIAMKEDLSEWLNQLYDLDMDVDNFMSMLETGVILCRHANNVIQKARELRDSGVPVPDYFLSPNTVTKKKSPPVNGSCSSSLMKSSRSFTGSPSPFLSSSRHSLGSINIPSSLLTKMTMQQRMTGTIAAAGNLSVTDSSPAAGDMTTEKTEGTRTTMTAESQSCRTLSSGLNDANQKEQQQNHQLDRMQHLQLHEGGHEGAGMIINDHVRREQQLHRRLQKQQQQNSNDDAISNDPISSMKKNGTGTPVTTGTAAPPATSPADPAAGTTAECSLVNINNNHIVVANTRVNGSRNSNINNSITNYHVSCKANAKSGTFHARDNVCNFITWCRSLLIRECLLFETEDLVLGKNEKSFILCLLEVARKGALLGMRIPLLVQLEQEIDQEIESDNRKEQQLQVDSRHPDPDDDDVAVHHHNNNSSKLLPVTRIPILKSASGSRIIPPERDDYEDDAKNITADQNDSQYNSETDSDTSSNFAIQPQIVTNDLKSLHEHVVDLLNRCTCPSQYPMIKVSDGKYRIGDTKTLIFVRILRRHVMVRVGGGWDTLEHYLDKHDPCRCYYTLGNGAGRRRSSAGLNHSSGSFNLKNGVRV